jgi:hypothetical protein
MFTLACNRAKYHPIDAIPFYAREVDTAIARKNWSGYTKAAELLVSLRDSINGPAPTSAHTSTTSSPRIAGRAR